MFNRSPRIQQRVTEDLIHITPPKPLPVKPQINWLTIGLPIIAVGIVIALMFLFSGSTSGLSYVMFLPLILASVLASVLNYRKQDRDYKEAYRNNFAQFDNEIENKKKKVIENKIHRLAVYEENDPPVSTCLDLVIHQASRLGERRPEDADFLTFRIGTGSRESNIRVEGISPDNRDPDYDPLYGKLDDLVQDAGKVDDAPVICNLKEIGTLGVAGNIEELRQFGWASVLYLLTHHWPSEVNITAFCSFVEVENWRWLEQVPHKTKLFVRPVIELRENKTVKQALHALEEELRRRKTVVQNGPSVVVGNKETILPNLVLIFDRISGIYNHAAFSILLKEGRALGVYGIFLVDRVQDIPSECGAIVSFDGGVLSYKITGPNKELFDDVKPDEASKEMVKTFANGLETIKWLIPQQVTDPPAKVSLLELFPFPHLEDLPIEDWWIGHYPFGYLRAPIGKFSPTADLIFDLNDNDTGHGPHGLIGGMTGSGKSELLKTLILSLALSHHPYDLNFALIDYKGGGAFDEFRSLPHVVGVITDIQNHADYATRVVQSLSGEIKRREKILVKACEQFGLSTPHIDEYRSKLKVRIPIPRLVIIFDEFAEFQERHQEDAKKLINIARVGRSLGIHMILCTQNPMGKAVDPQVRDNSNFTICLKVKNQETSKSLIGIPDAINLQRGDAYFKVHNPLKFRVAYTGEIYTYNPEYVGDKTKEIKPGERKYLIRKVSEAQAIVEEIKLQSKRLNIPEPLKVWPEPLPENLTLRDVILSARHTLSWNGNAWMAEKFVRPQLPIGILDDPLHQKQDAFLLDDNLLILGPSGSGKSISLLTIAMVVASTYSPNEAHIFCIDLSGQSPLKALEEAGLPNLPRIGGVISGGDTERINRLFSMLQAKLEERANKLRKSGRADDIGIFNSQQSSSNDCEPYIFVLVDGLYQQYNQINPGFKDQLDIIVRRGPTHGIYTIITGNLQRDVPDILQADIAKKILFQVAEKGTIQSVVGLSPETYQKKIEAGQELGPGRGLLNSNPTLEFQCALPIYNGEPTNPMSHVISVSKQMLASWEGQRPPDVESLPYFVTLDELQFSDTVDMFRIGKSQEALHPVGLSLAKDGPIFMIISMTPGLGKTSSLYLWLIELSKKYNQQQLKLVLIDYHTRTLRYFTKLPHIVQKDKMRSHVTRKEDLKGVLEWLNSEINARRAEIEKLYTDDPENFNEEENIQRFGYLVVVIDDYEAFNNSKTTDLLTACIVNGEEVGVRLVLTEDASLLGNDDLMKRAKKHGCGILLGGSDGLGVFNGAQPPYGQKTFSLPPGRGYLIRRGQAQLIQAAAYWNEGQDPIDTLKNRLYNK